MSERITDVQCADYGFCLVLDGENVRLNCEVNVGSPCDLCGRQGAGVEQFGCYEGPVICNRCLAKAVKRLKHK